MRENILDIPFTLRGYRTLLNELQGIGEFVDAKNFLEAENSIFLRHDVDISLNRALAMAKVEADLRIASTYFINLHSTHYNVLEASQNKLLAQILDLGHCIGIHLDARFHEAKSEVEVSFALEREAYVFSNFFGVNPEVFSFHDPSKEHIALGLEAIGGLVNTYSSIWQSNSTYLSDSNGYWRHKSPADVIRDHSLRPIQILIHPEWWTSASKQEPPRSRVVRAVLGRATKQLIDYDRALAAFDRLNIGSDSTDITRVLARFPEFRLTAEQLLRNREYKTLLQLLQSLWANRCDRESHVDSCTYLHQPLGSNDGASGSLSEETAEAACRSICFCILSCSN